MSYLKDARKAAMYCPDVVKRRELNRRIDALHDVFGRFTISCSKEDMLDLVGAWTRVEIALLMLPPHPEHGPNGGRLSVPTKKKVEIKVEAG